MFRFILLITVILLVSCNGNKTPKLSAEEIEANRIADSLQQVADSIAAMRNLQSMAPGFHVHNGKNLAADAHQDPKKKFRLKKKIYERTPIKQKANQIRNERIQKRIEEKQKEKERVDELF